MIFTGDGFDQVFCLFARDAHTTFKNAIQKIRALKKQNGKPVFKAITSTPCFEFWFLLHFVYSDRPFANNGSNSVCEQVVKELKEQDGFADYKKGKSGIANLLRDKQDTACKHAKQLRVSASDHKKDPQLTANPWTNVDELLEEIKVLASQQKTATTKQCSERAKAAQ